MPSELDILRRTRGGPVLPPIRRRPAMPSRYAAMTRAPAPRRISGGDGGGGLFGSIMSKVGGIVRPVASALDYGKSVAVASTLELGDWARAAAGKPGISGDFQENINRRVGVGDVLEENTLTKGLPMNVKRVLGGVGDVALDPLTYVTVGASTPAKVGLRRVAAAEGDEVARVLAAEGAQAADEMIAKRAAAKATPELIEQAAPRTVRSILAEGTTEKGLNRTLRQIERTGSGGVKLNLGRAGAPTLVKGETLGKIPGVQAAKAAGQAAKTSELGTGVRKALVPLTETRDAFGEHIARALPGIAARRQQLVDIAKTDLDNRLKPLLAANVSKPELDAVRSALDVGGTVEEGLKILDGAPDAQALLVELDRARGQTYDQLIAAGKTEDSLMPREEYLRHYMSDEGLESLGIKRPGSKRPGTGRPGSRAANLKERTREGSITEQNAADDAISYVDDPVKLTRSSYHYAQEVAGNKGAFDALEDLATKTHGVNVEDVVRHQAAPGYTQVAPGGWVADEIASDLFNLAKSGTQSSIVRGWDTFSSILKGQTLFNPVAFGPYFTQNMATGIAMNAARLGVGPREYMRVARIHRAVAKALKGAPGELVEGAQAAGRQLDEPLEAAVERGAREVPEAAAEAAPVLGPPAEQIPEKARKGWWRGAEEAEGAEAIDFDVPVTSDERVAVRQQVDDLAARAHAEPLDTDIVGQAALPPLSGAKASKGGEWDWVERLSAEERAAYSRAVRLKHGGETGALAPTIEQLGKSAGPDEWQMVLDVGSVDEAAEIVMQKIRANTALDQVSRGFKPWFPNDLPLDLSEEELALLNALPTEGVKGYVARGTRAGKAGRRSWKASQIDDVVHANREIRAGGSTADAVGPDPGVGPWVDMDEETWTDEFYRLYYELEDAAFASDEFGSPEMQRIRAEIEKHAPREFFEDGVNAPETYRRLREQTAKHNPDAIPEAVTEAAPAAPEPALAAPEPAGPVLGPTAGRGPYQGGEEGWEERLAELLPDPADQALAMDLRREGIFAAGHAFYDDIAEPGLQLDPSKARRVADFGTKRTKVANQYGEEMLRGAAYLKARAEGMTSEAAADVVRETHLDYSAVGRTRFERDAINRFVFFPTWLMRAPSAVVRTYAHRPGLLNQQAKLEMGPKYGERDRNEYGELIGPRLSGPLSFLTGVPQDIADTVGVAGGGSAGELLNPAVRGILNLEGSRDPNQLLPPLSILRNRGGPVLGGREGTVLSRDAEGVLGGRLGGALSPGAKRSRYLRSLLGVRTGVDYGRTGEAREFGHRVGRRVLTPPPRPTFGPPPQRRRSV